MDSSVSKVARLRAALVSFLEYTVTIRMMFFKMPCGSAPEGITRRLELVMIWRG
jgi:hypothetical protein